MDFTLKTYVKFLNALSDQGFSFLTFKEILLKTSDKAIVLRHDVDALPGNALQFARIQADMGIRGSYYFRIVPGRFDENIIKQIHSLGHEIGYHYEALSFAWAKLKAQGSELRAQGEEVERAIVEIGLESFKKNLEELRKIVPVKTICMHGSPLNRWDSRLLWKYYDYHDFGIIGEPYFDVNFDEVLYLTDTGRRWDGDSFNIRDKATGVRRRATGEMAQGSGLKAKGENPYQDWKVKPFKYQENTSSDLKPGTWNPQSGTWNLKPETWNLDAAPSTRRPTPFPKLHSTFDIIRAAEEGRLHDKIMMTFHPQRWTNKPVPWVKELVWQNVKNVVKYFVVRVNSEQ